MVESGPQSLVLSVADVRKGQFLHPPTVISKNHILTPPQNYKVYCGLNNIAIDESIIENAPADDVNMEMDVDDDNDDDADAADDGEEAGEDWGGNDDEDEDDDNVAVEGGNSFKGFDE